MLRRLQMFPELTKAHCSFFGAWENAVGYVYSCNACAEYVAFLVVFWTL